MEKMEKKQFRQEVQIPKGAKNVEFRMIDGKPYVVFDVYFNQSHKEILEEIKGTNEWLDKYFPVVHAGTITLDDEIFKHKPETVKQAFFKKRLEHALNMNIYNFRAQAMDPSLDENGNIIFKAGEMPAIGQPTLWWDLQMQYYFPQKRSRMGSPDQRVIFLGVLMRELVCTYNYTINDSWIAICDQSREICNCEDTIHGKKHMEPTGSRKIGKWADLGNVYKITKHTEKSFALEGSKYDFAGSFCSLSFIIGDHKLGNFHKSSLGWMVMDV